MKIESTLINGVFVLNNFSATDERGFFVKTYNKKLFEELDFDFHIRESFFSVSKKDVIRGMHFQLPPFDHEKHVYVTNGSILDVVLDLRKESPTYKCFFSVELSSENKKSIFIPKGLAHGFKSIEEGTTTVYNVSCEYNSSADAGINFQSFGFDWEVNDPIVSKRDSLFPGLNSFCKINPF